MSGLVASVYVVAALASDGVGSCLAPEKAAAAIRVLVDGWSQEWRVTRLDELFGSSGRVVIGTPESPHAVSWGALEGAQATGCETLVFFDPQTRSVRRIRRSAASSDRSALLAMVPIYTGAFGPDLHERVRRDRTWRSSRGAVSRQYVFSEVVPGRDTAGTLDIDLVAQDGGWRLTFEYSRLDVQP